MIRARLRELALFAAVATPAGLITGALLALCLLHGPGGAR